MPHAQEGLDRCGRACLVCSHMAANSITDYQDWRTTDEQEIARRRLRAEAGSFAIQAMEPEYPIFGDFQVLSAGSKREYIVEVRGPEPGQIQVTCTCPDFRLNGLGTCKHCEAVLRHLETEQPREWKKALAQGSPRVEIVPDPVADTLRVEPHRERLGEEFREWFDELDLLRAMDPEEAVQLMKASRAPGLRISREVDVWLEARKERRERLEMRRAYEQMVQQGKTAREETRVSLYPYQRQGMLHLAFTQRALLADAPGLGKRAAAAAACALVNRIAKAERVLILAPASVMEEWSATLRDYLGANLRELSKPSPAGEQTFTGLSFEQLLNESPDRVLQAVQPDIVILDEAHRLRNWTSPLAQAVKGFAEVRFAFVLTGATLTSRLDELYAVMDFLNPMVLGPLFRFNRTFYVFNEKGRPVDVRNLPQLRKQLAPVALRRSKADVEMELPDLNTRTYLVDLEPARMEAYRGAEAETRERFADLPKKLNAAGTLPRTASEDFLGACASLRRLCHGLGAGGETAPKRDIARLRELEAVLHQILDEPEAKVTVFSAWESALVPVRELCERLEIGFAWHTAATPERRRAMQATKFRADPECRVMLATDSGADELILPPTGYLIHWEPPLDPAGQARRHASVWRRNANFPLTAVYLAARGTIEQQLAADLNAKTAGSGTAERLLAWLVPTAPSPANPATPANDPAMAFAKACQVQLGPEFVLCEERTSGEDRYYLLVVQGDAALAETRIAPLWSDFQTPNASLQVLGQDAHAALLKMAASGLIQLAGGQPRKLAGG